MSFIVSITPVSILCWRFILNKLSMLNSNISQIHADDKEIAIANKILKNTFFSSYLLMTLNTLSPIIKKYIPDTKCENVSNQDIYLNKSLKEYSYVFY